MKKKNTPRLKVRLKEDIIVNEAVKLFLTEKIADNLSAETIDYYQRRIKKFTDFLTATEDKIWLCSDITSELVIEYKKHRQDSGVSEQTVLADLRGVRAFLYYCMENDYINYFKIKMPKTTEVVMDTYTEEEIQKLIKKPDINNCSFAELRNWTMVCFFLGTGCRVGTVINIKIEDINFPLHQIILRHTKNRNQYTIPLSQTLEQVMREYLQHRKGEADEYLFCNIYGEQLVRSTITTAIKNYNASRGIEKHSIHLFRHTFGRIFASTDGNAFKLQSQLGHTTMHMTMKYAKQFGNDLAKNFSEHSPLELLGDNIQPKSKLKVRREA